MLLFVFIKALISVAEILSKGDSENCNIRLLYTLWQCIAWAFVNNNIFFDYELYTFSISLIVKSYLTNN